VIVSVLMILMFGIFCVLFVSSSIMSWLMSIAMTVPVFPTCCVAGILKYPMPQPKSMMVSPG